MPLPDGGGGVTYTLHLFWNRRKYEFPPSLESSNQMPFALLPLCLVPRAFTGCPICSCTWVGTTVIWVFHHLSQPLLPNSHQHRQNWADTQNPSQPNRAARADGTPCTYTTMCRILKNSELREAPMERGSSHGSATNSCFHALPDSEIYTPEYMHFLWQLSAIKAASLRPPVSPLLSRLQGWGLTGKDRPWEYERDVEICPRDRLLMKSS